MNNTRTRTSIGPDGVGIAILALGTVGFYLYLFLVEGFPGKSLTERQVFGRPSCRPLRRDGT
jgi:hypothetical protein